MESQPQNPELCYLLSGKYTSTCYMQTFNILATSSLCS